MSYMLLQPGMSDTGWALSSCAIFPAHPISSIAKRKIFRGTAKSNWKRRRLRDVL